VPGRVDLPPECRPSEDLGASSRIDARTGVSAADVDELQTAVRSQKTRMLALQQELNHRVQELTQCKQELADMHSALKVAQDEVKKLRSGASSMENEKTRLETTKKSQEEKIKALEQEVVERKRENDALGEKYRRSEKDSQAKDARLHRLLEEVERYKASLKEARAGDKDRDAGARKETERLQAENKALVRQRGELLGAFRKQMKLIDVLKRQKVHLEAARMLAFTEEEFMRVLELGEKLTT